MSVIFPTEPLLAARVYPRAMANVRFIRVSVVPNLVKIITPFSGRMEFDALRKMEPLAKNVEFHSTAKLRKLRKRTKFRTTDFYA